MPNRKSPRAQRFDYTSSGGYFVTICTKDRLHYFGEICRDGFETHPTMKLNEIGNYCHQEIQRLSERTSVDIHEWVVMPNHIHLLLIMYDFDPNKNIGYERRDAFATRPEIGSDQGRATSPSLPSESITVQREDYHGPRLGQIVGVLKSNITKYAIANNIPFARQSRYHDHIIRNEGEYERIKYYIETNPENREKDCFAEM